ncbi:MAG: DUF1015 domain-containing protein [Clostridia bacterium]|nr:DUF1015 domain-containing protein [Clostridia bacterium]
MAIFKPFRALRPVPEFASRVAALPYDVMSSAEAREMVKGNPYSFLHVDKAEIDLPEDVDLYSEEVYAKAAANLKKSEEDGVCRTDPTPCFYVYRQIMNGRAQTGLVGCASVDDYRDGHIKRHELTRADKEADRIHHVDTCDANTGPIFLCYRGSEGVDAILQKVTAGAPVYDFVTDDGIANTVWVIDNADDCAALSALLADAGDFYIADGHHRCASAVRVAERRRAAAPDYDGTEEFNFFLAVLFPTHDLEIMDYNRVVADLCGRTEEEFLAEVGKVFGVEKAPQSPFKPTEKHTFGMYLGGTWYKLTAPASAYDENDPVSRLDVTILQNNLLTPLLNIGDPRTDKRIDFVGGIRGLCELERRVDGGMAVAFSMYPTTLDDLTAIADAGLIMPPKSTWFEPKLLSGLFIHKLS